MAKNKKIIYSFGALVVAATPLIAVVSCGNNNIPETTYTAIDLEDCKSIHDIFVKINKVTKIQMSESVGVIGKVNSDEFQPVLSELNIKKLQTYFNNIQNGNFIFIYKKNKKIIKINIKNYLNVVLKNIENYSSQPSRWYYDLHTKSHATAFINAYLNKLTNDPFANSIWANSYGLKSFNYPAWNNYIYELNAWHNFFWSLKTSILFKTWVDKKNIQYYLPKSVEKNKTITKLNTKMQIAATDLTKYKPNTQADNEKYAKNNFDSRAWVNPKIQNQSTNIEAEFSGFMFNFYSAWK